MIFPKQKKWRFQTIKNTHEYKGREDKMVNWNEVAIIVLTNNTSSLLKTMKWVLLSEKRSWSPEKGSHTFAVCICVCASWTVDSDWTICVIAENLYVRVTVSKRRTWSIQINLVDIISYIGICRVSLFHFFVFVSLSRKNVFRSVNLRKAFSFKL